MSIKDLSDPEMLPTSSSGAVYEPSGEGTLREGSRTAGDTTCPASTSLPPGGAWAQVPMCGAVFPRSTFPLFGSRA